ncbi:alpha/beta-hydrolase [Xylariaceae sp. FL0662B]|nr:alpha/beta-hydrolase [Xylariaceae sp. FL0662B]
MPSQESLTKPLLSEKANDVPRPAYQPLPRKRSWSWVHLNIIVVIVLVGFGVLGHFYHDYTRNTVYHQGTVHQEQSKSSKGWTIWSDITPSEKLQWHPCFSDDLQCARLIVPMDYHRPLNESADNPKVHIALVMAPGANRSQDPLSFSESPLLINPGGPGGSGAMFVAASSSVLRTAVGSHRDIIGFDPRGVGATTPKADCFSSPNDTAGIDQRTTALINRLSWTISGHDIGHINSSNVALSKLDVRSRAVTKLCKQVDDAEGDNSIFRYSNTPNVARDMLSIIHAWDEWRTTSIVKPAKESETPDPSTEIESKDALRGKLVYWGFSYGTVLGATFAAMFPDRVGRVVLDGVVDADHYVEPAWMDFLRDTDSVWDKFFLYCAESGPHCQLFQLGDGPEDIRKRVDEIMSRLQREPAIVITPRVQMPFLVTASDVKSIIFLSLYAPIRIFPIVDVLLKLISDGQLDLLVDTQPPASYCSKLDMPVWPDDAQRAIACSDRRYKLNEDLPALQQRFEKMANYSSFADIWMGLNVNLGCNGWDIEAKDPPMRWDDHPAHKPAPVNTSFPILFLSNHLDPVTPLHAALKMSRKFSGCSVVEQKAEGHCTISCISLCTINYLRAYLDKGIVPPTPRFDSGDDGEWPVCECNERPWKSIDGGSPFSSPHLRTTTTIHEELLNGKTSEETETMMAYRDLRNRFVEFTTFQQRFEHHNPLRDAVLRSPMFTFDQDSACCKS